MTSPDVRRLLVVRGLRAFGDGYVSLLLPVYLLALGLTPFQIGVIATATLLGSGLLTLPVGLHAYRFRYRSLLLLATALMAATGLAFAAFADFWPLLIVAVVGTLNPSSGDVSVFLPLEQAVLARIARTASALRRSRATAWSARWSARSVRCSRASPKCSRTQRVSTRSRRCRQCSSSMDCSA